MKSLTLTSLSAALLACSLAACNGATPPPPPAAPNAPNAPETALGRAAERAINKARAELATQNINLNGEFNFSGNNHRNVMARVGKRDASDPRPDAQLTPDGDLVIDGKKVEVTPQQHAMLVAYRKQIMAVAETGMALGVAGADMGGKALGEVARGLFSGNPDQIDKNIKEQAGALEAQAKVLCTQLQPIFDSQQKLASSLPAFKPYATMTQADVDDCTSKSDNSGNGGATRDKIREEVQSSVRDSMRGDAAASAAAAGAAASADAAASGREAADAAREAGRQARDAARDAAQEAKTAAESIKRANQPCNFKRPIDLKLDMVGVKTVQFRISSEDIVIDAGSAAPAVTGAACASTQAALDTMKVEQRREGERLIVTASHSGNFSGISNINFGPLKVSRYSYLRLNAMVPENVTVQVVAGSGDIRVNNAMRTSVDLGSGDAVLNRVRQGAYVKLSSGNIDINGAGSVHVLEIGSGDVNLRDITGATQVDELGSGDLKLVKNGGDVVIGTIGSGDIELVDIGGNVKVARVGSGDVTARNVKGGLTVDRIGSGDVNHGGVSGPVSIPKGH